MNSINKTLIITDSLGLPRDFPENVNYSKTWPKLLSRSFEIYQISKWGATIEDLYNQVVYSKSFNPDIVIIQAGIVDCAPRALSKLESDIINKFKIFSFVFSKLINKKSIYFLRKYRNINYTSISKFEEFIIKLNNEFNNLIWIPIIPACKDYESLVPNISININKYNNLLNQELVTNCWKLMN
ncbi:MAG: hypothetical protein ACK4IK_05055 [Bacteroidia bacterium]